MKYILLNVPEFDGATNSSSSLSRPCGRAGPSLQANVPPTASASTDQAIQFMTAFFAAHAQNPTLIPLIPSTMGAYTHLSHHLSATSITFPGARDFPH